jgi:flagellin-like protein
MELIQTLRATISGDDDRGVSPVIGVILMVAITVILAAVIATFVLGLGEQVSSTAPQVTVDWDQTDSDGTADTYNVTATHNGGATVENSSLQANGGTNGTVGTNTEISSGETLATWTNTAADETIRVVWESDGGSTTATLSEYTVNA